MLPIRQDFQGKVLGLVRKYNPSAAHAFEVAKYKNDLVVSALLEKRMTFGNANRLNKEAYLESLNMLSEQAQKEMEQARQLEMQRAQVLMQGAALMQQAQQVSAPQRHEITNCRWIGNTLNCTSF